MRAAVPFSIDTRVYYEDTDASGVVYHADYLRYFERARTEWLESRGQDHRTLADRYGLAFTLADMTVRFIRPARLGDRLVVTAEIGEHRRARIVFEQEIWRSDELLIHGKFTVACVSIGDFRPRRVPEMIIRGDEI